MTFLHLPSKVVIQMHPLHTDQNEKKKRKLLQSKDSVIMVDIKDDNYTPGSFPESISCCRWSTWNCLTINQISFIIVIFPLRARIFKTSQIIIFHRNHLQSASNKSKLKINQAKTYISFQQHQIKKVIFYKGSKLYCVNLDMDPIFQLLQRLKVLDSRKILANFRKILRSTSNKGLSIFLLQPTFRKS